MNHMPWSLRGRRGPRLAMIAALCLGAGLAAAQPAAVAPAASTPARAAAALPAEAFFRHPDVLQAELSPSGQRLAITAAKGTERVGLIVIELGTPMRAGRAAQFRDVDIVDFRWVSDDRLVFSVVDLGAGSGEAGARQWLFDSAGEPRVAVSGRDGRSAVYWRAPGQPGWRLLVEAPALGMPFTPRFVDDAGGLYVLHRQGPEGLSVLSRFDFERGRPADEPWVSVAGFDFDGSLIEGRRGGAAAGVRAMSDAETTVWFDERLKKLQQDADARWPAHVNRLSCRRCDAADMVALVRSYADRDPGRLWLYRADSGRWQAVTAVLDGIEPATMARVDFQRIQARDGRDLPIWLTLPAGVDPARPGRPLPTVVMVHGGPWVRGGHWRWEPMAQFLASRGYLVVSPEFRGSTGYGEAHFRAGFKQWGQAMQDDIADALLWAQRQGLSATGRACIAGASYGGYATLMGLVRHPDLYRCGVAWVAVTDPLLFLEGSWWVSDDIGSEGRRWSLPEMVGDAKADAEMLTRVSPLAQAASIRAPLLLAFGESDLRVPLAHGTRLRDALRRAGREPLWVTYPDEGHSWRLPATRADFARRVERFLAEQLGPPADARPPP